MWQPILFCIFAAGFFGYSGYRFSLLYKLAKTQTGKAPNRLDRIPERLIQTFINVIGQKAVLQKPLIGILHTLIFWGFIIITVGTLEQLGSTLIPGFSFEFLGDPLYPFLVYIQDFFTSFVLFAVLGALYRRVVVKPTHLGQSRDAYMVLAFTGGLMVSIFMMNAFHLIATDSGYEMAMPMSRRLADILRLLSLSPETSANLAVLFKWIHMTLVMGFAAYIPTSKHLHIVAAGPNTFLKQLDRAKPMSTINFEDESITQYGAGKISDLNWKDSLDYFSCTECGRCQELCPAWNTEKPLSPKKLILDLKHQLFDQKEKLLAGKKDELPSIIDKDVTEDVIWACTSCRACEIACPVFIEHTDKIFDIRRNLVMMESKFPAEVQSVFKNMETNGTPWAFAAAERANWAQGLDIKTLAENPEYDVLLWVGCAGPYDERNKKVMKAFVNILNKAKVKFAILGTEETCTGDSARRIGNEYLFQTLAKINVENLNRYQVKRIVTACPHCFNTIKNEYKDFGGNYEVFHHSEFISKLLSEGKLNPSKTNDSKVTYHDSCYLGRWNNVYDQPRDALAKIPGITMTEMKQNHDQSMCCGAGGGRMWMEEHIGRRVNVTRTEQAIDTGANVIAAACPFCMTMISDGVKTKEKTDSIRVLDIAELVDESVTN